MPKFEVTVRLKNNTTETKEVYAGCAGGATNKAYEAYGFKPHAKVKDIVVKNVKLIKYE